VTPEAIRKHLDISENHEAGLIPMSTQVLLEEAADTIDELLAKIVSFQIAVRGLRAQTSRLMEDN